MWRYKKFSRLGYLLLSIVTAWRVIIMLLCYMLFNHSQLHTQLSTTCFSLFALSFALPNPCTTILSILGSTNLHLSIWSKAREQFISCVRIRPWSCFSSPLCFDFKCLQIKDWCCLFFPCTILKDSKRKLISSVNQFISFMGKKWLHTTHLLLSCRHSLSINSSSNNLSLGSNLFDLHRQVTLLIVNVQVSKV